MASLHCRDTGVRAGAGGCDHTHTHCHSSATLLPCWAAAVAISGWSSGSGTGGRPGSSISGWWSAAGLNSATLSASCRRRAQRGAVARPAVECMCLHQMQDAGQRTGHGGRLQRQRCQAYMLPQVLQPCIQRHCLKHFAAAAEHGIAARGIATISRGRTGKAIPTASAGVGTNARSDRGEAHGCRT